MIRRVFIKNAALGGAAFFMPFGIFLPGRQRLKDNFWLWGQNAGSHHVNNAYNLPGVNRMESREGCDYLNIDKCCRVAMGLGPFPPYNNEAEKLKDLKEVVWSGVGTKGLLKPEENKSDLEEILRIARIYPNITGVIMDDFFRGKSIPYRLSYEYVKEMSDTLHKFDLRPLDFWLVWYTTELDLDVSRYIDLFDVITLWTMKGSDLIYLDDNISKFISKTPGKRRLAGCCMWNYREKKPLTMYQMKYQLDRYYYWIKKGAIEGIVFCSNCIADIGLETVDYTRKWIAEVGRENLKK